MKVRDINPGGLLPPEFPEGGRDAVQVVRDACVKLDGHEPIVVTILEVGVLMVCTSAPPDAAKHAEVRAAVASPLTSPSPEAARDWIGSILKEATVDGCYALAFVTERGSVDVYGPFDRSRLIPRNWLDRMLALNREIEKSKPTNRHPEVLRVVDNEGDQGGNAGS